MRQVAALKPDPAAIDEREVSFESSDGFPLRGTLFCGAGNGPLVLVSSAAAVPRKLYAAFARAIVAQGAGAALIYDYRGTGGSRPPSRWRGRLNMKDWGALDFPAALARLEAVAPGAPAVGVGQSFGGQALGLSGVAERFTRYAMVASMSGYHRALDDRTVWPLMNLVGLPVSLLTSTIPRWLGIGEPIPASVFRDWARWCRMPDYFFDDPAVRETERFAAVRLPILALGLTDDKWGTPAAIEGLMRHYVNAQVETRFIAPQDAGASAIGHLGFFRSRFRETLWPPLIAWLLDGRPMTIGSAVSEQ